MVTNSFITLAKKRYSCRTYKNNAVEPDKITTVLEAARVAPSAKNLQPWHFVVINEAGLLQKIKQCYQRRWIDSAPVIIAVIGDHSKTWRRNDGKSSLDIDVSIAITHLMLQATEMGLATCWIGKFNAWQCAEILSIPEGQEPIALIPLGYPADEANEQRHALQRKNMNEIVSWNKL